MGVFLLEAALISLSGVLAPGPMTAVTVGEGTRSPHVGAWIAIGHGIIEIPLMIGVLYGFGTVLNHPTAQAVIGLVGGLFLLFLGINMLRRFRHVQVDPQTSNRSPIMTGIVLSAGNPYFLIWWATVGATLVMKSVGFGILGFSAFAVLHWLCDFIWCYLLSALSFRGRGLLGGAFQRAVLVLSGAALLLFGGKFLADAVRALFL
ncbi:LysE family transporter [Candidatus Bipolaricaulota bacterium]